MPTQYKRWLLPILLLAAGFTACHGGDKKTAAEQAEAKPATPVTVTTIGTGDMAEYADLSATSVFLQKNYIKANVNGYIKSVSAQPGKFVTAGQALFTVQTKESQSIGNAVNKLDPSFRFSGVNTIKASGTGYITQLNHQVGDYVQDGEQLAVISDANSFAFLLNLPFELKQYVKMNSAVTLTLPDNTTLQGTISAALPSVDPGSQTQGIVIKVPGDASIPENLVAKVRIVKTDRAGAISLPREAVLTNDVQSDFWVMKMTDTNTAVKVPVKKGIEANNRVEILSPAFTPADRILLTGNYGLPDTARVQVIQQH